MEDHEEDEDALFDRFIIEEKYYSHTSSPCNFQEDCKITHEDVQNIEILQQTTTEKNFKCTHCSKAFKTHRSLGEHLVRHKESKSDPCAICQKTFKNSQCLRAHMRNHRLAKDEQECPICGKKLSSKKCVKNHIRKMHERSENAENPIICDECGKISSNIHQHKQHLVAHSSIRLFECSMCSQTFKYKQSLEKHKIIHSAVTPFECEMCGMKFKRADSLQQHGKIHLEKSLKCPYCDLMYNRNINLKNHVERIHRGLPLIGKENTFSCTICNEAFTDLEILKTHVEAHVPDERYECERCNKSYLRKDGLNKHLRRCTKRKTKQGATVSVNSPETAKQEHKRLKEPKETIENEEYQCSDCGKLFNRRNHLQSHMMSHSDTRDYQCAHCSIVFKSKNNLINHIAIHAKTTLHCGRKPRGSLKRSQGTKKWRHRCFQCEKTFSSKRYAEKHFTTIHEGRDKPKTISSLIVCDECGKISWNQVQHRRHMIVHSDVVAFECTKCTKKFKYRQALVRHQGVHTEKKPFECFLCSKKYKTKSSLRLHMHTHMDKSIKCPHCDIMFNRKIYLKCHVERIHRGLPVRIREGPNHCTICKEAFDDVKDLITHAEDHPKEKNYVCDKCGKVYLRLDGLYKHIRVIHEGLKRPEPKSSYTCPHCSKTFKQRFNLKSHLISHSDEKPFVCLVCSMAFKYKISLDSHLAKHTGKDPYQCCVCRKTFKWKRNWSRHEALHNSVSDSFNENSLSDIIEYLSEEEMF